MKSEKLLNNWRFMLNRAGWQRFEGEEVALPHDFMLATPRTPDSPTWADYGYFQPCKGTYVRKLMKPEAENVLLRFDGVMGLTEVFVNGECAGFHPYGYTAFTVDIAKFLHEGENEIRVELVHRRGDLPRGRASDLGRGPFCALDGDGQNARSF